MSLRERLSVISQDAITSITCHYEDRIVRIKQSLYHRKQDTERFVNGLLE